MAKKKRNVLFQVQNPIPRPEEEAEEQHDQEQFSPEHHMIQKKELILVFIVFLTISVVFFALWLTNHKKNWINGISEKTAKVLIRGF